MMNGTATKIRPVLCPKCRCVLVEDPEIPLYKCGKCETVLRAKYFKSGANLPNKVGANGNASLDVDSPHNGSVSSNGKTVLGTQHCSPLAVSNIVKLTPTYDGYTASSVKDNLEAKFPYPDSSISCNDVVDNQLNSVSNADAATGILGNTPNVEDETDDVSIGRSEMDNQRDEVPHLDGSSCSNSRQLSPEKEIESQRGDVEHNSLDYLDKSNENILELENAKDEGPPTNSGSSSCNSEQLSPQANGKTENDEVRVEHTVLCEMLEKSLDIGSDTSSPVRLPGEKKDYLESAHPNSREVHMDDRPVDNIHGSPVRKPPAMVHHAYDASISSFDDCSENRFPSGYQLISKRTFRSNPSSEQLRSIELDEMNNSSVNAKTKKASYVVLPENAARLMNQRYSSETMGSFMSDRDEFPTRNVAHASEDFYSVQNWTETDKDNSSLRSLSRGSEFDPSGPDRLELLRKIDELRDQLARSTNQWDERLPHLSGRNQIGGWQSSSSSSASEREIHRLSSIQSHVLDPYGTRRAMLGGHLHHASPSSVQSDHAYFCLHCTSAQQRQAKAGLPAALYCSNELCGSYCYACSQHGNLKCRLHSDPQSLPQKYSRNPSNLHRKVRDQSRKRHYRAVLGGANLLTCYECLKVLQIPEEFHFSKKRCNKLRCGACSKVLSLAVVNKNQIVPYSLAHQWQLPTGGGSITCNNDTTRNVVHVPPENRHFSQWRPKHDSYSDEYGPSYGRSCEIEDEHVQYVSRDSMDSMMDRGINKPPLHSLMGYISASEIIYKH